MKKQITGLFLIIITLSSCKKNSEEQISPNKPSHKDIIQLAKEIYIFGYPIVIMDRTKRASTNVKFPVKGQTNAPVNQFGHFTTFPDATFNKVVKPNCDTYYSNAWLDLTAEPLVLSVPNTNGRYYIIPILDAYSNVFASLGKRTTGTKAQDFLITGPDYQNKIPNGMKEIKSPTNMAWIIGRTQVNSKEDGQTIVAKIQEGYKIIPLSKYGRAYKPEAAKIDTNLDKTPPPAAIEKMDIQSFFDTLGKLVKENPISPKDPIMSGKLTQIRITGEKKFKLSDFDQATQNELKKIPQLVHEKMRSDIKKLGKNVNGWMLRTNLGNYSRDYNKRALIAMFGLGANIDQDAIYPSCTVDNNGNPLNGNKKYVLHFDKDKIPPVNAFWSITMYNPSDLLVANSINRFAIGDRNNLKYNKDGSLDIYIQNEKPGKEKISNWLPANNGNFSLTMRLYWPKEQALNGQWKPLPVKII